MDAAPRRHGPFDGPDRFGFVLHCPEPPGVVWGRLWDLGRHTAQIPFTRVASADGRPLGPGQRFTGRTALGRIGFDDDMVVRRWEPTRYAEIQKVGRLLRGRIEVTLGPEGGGSRLEWRQEFAARGVPSLLARAVAPMVGGGYRRTVRRIIREP